MKVPLILAAAFGLFVTGILLLRVSQQLRNRIRYFNKHFLNHIMIQFAGATHSPISIVRHTGRRSGKRYATPVIVEPVRDGFIFALTYGPEVDWYRNLLAAGEGGLRWRGKEYALERPETLDVETALQAFPFPFQPVLRFMGIRDFFIMRRRDTGTNISPGHSE